MRTSVMQFAVEQGSAALAIRKVLCERIEVSEGKSAEGEVPRQMEWCCGDRFQTWSARKLSYIIAMSTAAPCFNDASQDPESIAQCPPKSKTYTSEHLLGD